MFPRIRRNLIVAVALAGCAIGGSWNAESLSAQMADEANWRAPAWVLDQAGIATFRRDKLIPAKAAQKATNPSNQQIQALNSIVHYYMSQLVAPARARLPKEVVERFLANEFNPQTSTPKARELMMDEVIVRSRDLLDHPDSIVRTNLLLLLIQLSTEPPRIEGRGEVPAVPYNPVNRVLIEVLTDRSQLPEVRILAARGLGRLGRDGVGLDGLTRSAIAVALVDTLAQLPIEPTDDNWWLRYRIVEALGYVERLKNVAEQPIVIDTLFQVLTNPQEAWLIRSQAALSLSRLPFDGSTNIPLVTYEITNLLVEMADAYDNSKEDPAWRQAFGRVYLSFRPSNQAQANRFWGLLYQGNRPGLGAHKDLVLQAFDAAFPVMKPVVIPRTPGEAPAAIPRNALMALKEWVANHAPEDRRPTPTSRPLTVAAEAVGGGPEK